MSNHYDIERLPTSTTAKRMLKRVSPIYHNAYVAKWLYQVMGMEWDEVWKYVNSLRDQIYPLRVTWGIEYQEYKYSITPDNTLTLEERRARLHIRRANKGPLNPAVLEKHIRDTFGLDTDIDESQSGILQIEFCRLTTFDIADIYNDLYDIKPSHLSINIRHVFDGEGEIFVGGIIQVAAANIVDVSTLDVQVDISDTTIYMGGIIGHQCNTTTVDI